MIATGTLEQDKAYLWSKFKDPVFDPDTGLDSETIKANVLKLAEELKHLPHPVVKARAFEYVARHVRIDVNPHDWFVAFGCYDRWNRPLDGLVAKWDREVDDTRLTTLQLMQNLKQSGACGMGKDFDHSVPDWDALFALGFPGIRQRARSYRRRRQDSGQLTPEAEAYFDGIEITYTAILDMLGRFRDHAMKHADGDERVLACAACLDSLIQGPPTNTYEVLQLIYLYFMISEYVDRLQVRSLGNLDRTVYPYYRKDLQEGRYTEAQIREFFAYFMMQFASIANPWGHPFYFGGTRRDGQSEINELSYLILDEFDKLDICSPKLQLKISPNTPAEFIDKAVDIIRRGRNSMVFLCEPSIKRAMMGYGATEEEARTCDITGCYEFVPRARGNTTIVAYLNMLKPLELALYDGVDPFAGIDLGCRTGGLDAIRTFDDLHAAYLKQLGHIIESAIRCANDFEQHLNFINPTNAYSATIENSLATARDAFHDGSIYNISSILTAGFATAVDAMMAVREFVFEKQELSLRQLKDVLRDNWKGHEKLRLRMLQGRSKYGNGIDAVDFYAETLSRFLGNKINMRPNGRGGFYLASMHTPPRYYLTHGQKTGATPDGRLAGEEISRNISPTMGMDINGVTALIRSATRMDSALHPADFPLDVMLHPATVEGDEGLVAMRTLLNAYMQRHGIAIQFNVFDADTLIDAQSNPDKYRGLQVRVCGWNVHFTDLSRKEQDMFIRRAQNISG
ncbi:MAG TPA: pyruvate formate lyase family protein [Phycisphaerae bacterium]|nr:pyruvate formate lyase family protein [Phycisphaerae bacterium]